VEVWKMAQKKIAEVQQQTPKRSATFVTEDDKFWFEVPCDGGCGRANTVAKTYLKPVDSMNFDDPEYIEVHRTAPPAWRCVCCRPSPRT
jgi:hypothetical protein